MARRVGSESYGIVNQSESESSSYLVWIGGPRSSFHMKQGHQFTFSGFCVSSRPRQAQAAAWLLPLKKCRRDDTALSRLSATRNTLVLGTLCAYASHFTSASMRGYDNFTISTPFCRLRVSVRPAGNWTSYFNHSREL